MSLLMLIRPSMSRRRTVHRKGILKELAEIEGVYVPRFYPGFIKYPIIKMAQ
ncbi:MAG: hypothetical protein DDT31_01703 [Syntrophomonadaceae bacterium]|nr:hypothetical protein [Bacillota bacterium]